MSQKKACLAASSSKNYVDQHRASGRVLGMTGTLGSDMERVEQHKTYGFTLFSIPPHQKTIRNDQLKPTIVNDNAHFEAVYQALFSALSAKKPARPVLIFCVDANATKALHEFIKKRSNSFGQWLRAKWHGVDLKKLQCYTGLDAEQNEADVVEKAGTSGMVTLTTSILGRGRRL